MVLTFSMVVDESRRREGEDDAADNEGRGVAIRSNLAVVWRSMDYSEYLGRAGHNVICVGGEDGS